MRMKNKMAGLLMETGRIQQEKLHRKKYFARLLKNSKRCRNR